MAPDVAGRSGRDQIKADEEREMASICEADVRVLSADEVDSVAGGGDPSAIIAGAAAGFAIGAVIVATGGGALVVIGAATLVGMAAGAATK
jgi:hypothetical protein